MTDGRLDWELSGRRDHSPQGVVTHPGTPFSVAVPRLIIFGKEDTVIDASGIVAPESEEEQTLLSPVTEGESMYHLGCKPRVVYIAFPSPFEKDSSVFGYLPESVLPGTELIVAEEERSTQATRSESPETPRARLHRKCDSQTHDTENLMTIWCFSTRQNAARTRIGKRKHRKKLHDSQGAASCQPMIALGGTIREFLEKHFNRIFEVQSRLEIVRKENASEEEDNDKGKTTPLEVDSEVEEEDASKMLKREEEALKDKEMELNRQTLEFLQRLKSTYDDDLTNSSQSVTWTRSRMKCAMSLECNRLYAALPIYARRSEIVETVKENQVTVLVGETGCGKSTQIPQYLYEAGLADNGAIVCTQPRKVAVTALAQKVAEEMDTALGDAVGYMARYWRRWRSTKVLYCTDDILMRECLWDRELSAFSCIIVDEAHERSIFTDLLLGMIKKCLENRPNLRVVITSATIEPELFVSYFGGCKALHVSGRQFPVEIVWGKGTKGKDLFHDYVARAVKKAIEIHKSLGIGDILVFLATPAEVDSCCLEFDQTVGEYPKRYVVIPLHGKLQKYEQQRVFEPSPRGERKIIFSTNSGETSVTIPTVKYVIDTGIVKERNFDDKSKMNVLALSQISKSRAIQRMGRAGRLCPGKCFRLYTEEDYRNMATASLPEILRGDVSLALLKLMDLNVDPLTFDYVTAPSKTAVEEAKLILVSIGAVGNESITHLGRRVAKLALEPRFGALVYEGHRKRVASEAIVLASMGSWTNVFLTGRNDVIKQRQISLHHSLGDQLTNLNVFRAWYKLGEGSRGEWCRKHCINDKAMMGIYGMVKDIICVMQYEWGVSIRLYFGEYAETDALVVEILAKVFCRNLSYSLGHPQTSYRVVSKKMNLDLSHSSVVRIIDPLPEWIVFDTIRNVPKSETTRCVTRVPEELLEVGVREGWLPLEIDEIRKTRYSGSLRKTVSLFKQNLQREKSLKPLGSKRNNVRAVMGTGGCTTNILMPDECRLVIIRCPENSETGAVSKKDMLKAFGRYGEIEECKRFIQTEESTGWGLIVYKDIESALRAIGDTRDSLEWIAEPNGGSCFTRIIQWDRDPIIDSGYITFSQKEYADKAKSFDFALCTSFKRAQLVDHKKENTLRILRLEHLVKGKTFRTELARALNISPILDIFKVKMPRENVEESKDKDARFKRTLLGRLAPLREAELFHLYFKTPQKGDTSLSAFCIHRNPSDASFSWKEFGRRLLSKDQVSEETINDCSICIMRIIFTKFKRELKKQMKELDKKGTTTGLTRRKSDSRVLVYLRADDPNVLAEGIDAIGRTIAGEVVDCRDNPRSELLFSEAGRTILDYVMHDTDTLILADKRLMTLTLYGSDGCRESAREVLAKEMGALSRSALEIGLRGAGRPPGLMHYLMDEFGSSFVRFKMEADLESVELDPKRQVLRVTGLSASRAMASSMVDDVGQKLIDGDPLDNDCVMNPECASCSHPTPAKKMYRLVCGHGYCELCLRALLHHVIASRGLPLVCIVTACGTYFEWRDIERCADEGYLRLVDLVDASVNSFMAQHKEDLRYCLTPTCPSVYRVTEAQTPFTCPQCVARICTSCHTYYHSGLTCAQYEAVSLRGKARKEKRNKKKRLLLKPNEGKMWHVPY